MLSTGFISRLVGAFVKGDENLLTKLVENKLESMGEDALMSLIGGPIAMAGQVGNILQTGGAANFNRLRDQWLNNLKPGPLPYQKMLQRVFESREHHRGRDRAAKWTRTDWAKSRQDWLNNLWQHNWESQPRDYHGRWIIGRLSRPYVARHPKRQKGIKARRLRNKRRRMARRLARQMLQQYHKPT